MADRIELLQSELDNLFANRGPHVKTEREKIEDAVHEKFQEFMPHEHSDMTEESTGVEKSCADDEYTGAISQEELDRVLGRTN